jgi:ethanolamine ammonia-lyase large subunit
MSQLISPTLEVTRVLFDRARATRFYFGSDTALVAVQHMLLQTVDLFANIIAMGLDPKNIVALGKIYSNNDSVIRALRDQGVTVVESMMPSPGVQCLFARRRRETLASCD